MGSSMALLFSHLATNAVVAFSPQVDLEWDGSHVGLSDMSPRIRRKFCNMQYHSVGLALNAGVHVIIHWGLEESDVRHTDLLEDCFLSRHVKERAVHDWGGIIGMSHL
jgi:hypothetical protein